MFFPTRLFTLLPTTELINTSLKKHVSMSAQQFLTHLPCKPVDCIALQNATLAAGPVEVVSRQKRRREKGNAQRRRRIHLETRAISQMAQPTVRSSRRLSRFTMGRREQRGHVVSRATACAVLNITVPLHPRGYARTHDVCTRGCVCSRSSRPRARGRSPRRRHLHCRPPLITRRATTCPGSSGTHVLVHA